MTPVDRKLYLWVRLYFLPFGENVLTWWCKSVKALNFEEVTSFCKPVDFMAPPMSLSVAAALDDQTPEQQADHACITNTK